jgi:predicted unusual protein kinase regulating ubiquinone biosynthesis (AarF/ABC1/UbiB family)
MKTNTKAFILFINKIHNINMQCCNNLLIIGRFFYLFYIFTSETIKFHFNNLINSSIHKLPKNERLELVKSITYKLEELNIIYVKIFQSLCLEKDILYPNEKDYLLKYTDNVPYTSDEVDYELLDLMESKYNIRLEDTQPINSGIIGVVFKGLDGNNNDSKVVIKILKNNIEKKLNAVFNEIECLTYIISYIPFLNNLNLHKLFLDNKESLLSQVIFLKEVTNIEIFKFKYKNLLEYRIPYVYKEITNIYNNVIVMENIKGLTINDLEKYDSNIKEEFGKLLMKLGFISIIYNSAVHCDLHAGNIFFYINDTNSGLPKYQLGLIDFGICSYPDKNNQNYYYIFFNDFFYKKDFSDKEKFNNVIKNIIHEKEYFDNISLKKKEQLILNSKECILKCLEKDFDIIFLMQLGKIFKKYNLSFSNEFNQICLSLNSCNSLGKILCNHVTNTQYECIEELTQINKLIEI